MDFSTITNLNTYLNSMKMKTDWQEKAKNPGLYADSGKDSGSSILDLLDPNRTEQSANEQKAGSIWMKVQSGQDISAGELEYLREHSPDLYREAMKVMQEKKAYEEALRRCESKEEVQALHMGKVSEALSTIKSAMERNDVGACIAANMKLNTFSAVLTEFTETAEYQEMADTYSELASEKAEAAKELAGTEDVETDEAKVEEAPETVEDVPQNPEEEKQPEAGIEDGKEQPTLMPGAKETKPDGLPGRKAAEHAYAKAANRAGHHEKTDWQPSGDMKPSAVQKPFTPQMDTTDVLLDKKA